MSIDILGINQKSESQKAKESMDTWIKSVFSLKRLKGRFFIEGGFWYYNSAYYNGPTQCDVHSDFVEEMSTKKVRKATEQEIQKFQNLQKRIEKC